MSIPGAVPQFGKRVPGAEYIVRPSAYVVLTNARNDVAIVRTPMGIYLPGGGQDRDESPEAAAIREVAEECGFAAVLEGRLGVADQYAYSEAEKCFFLKRCTFFRARVVGVTTATETDHEVCWLESEAAERELTHESHSWVLAELRRHRGMTG